MNFIISSFSGYFYVLDKKTGKRLIDRSFRDYESALYEAKKLKP